jgi:ParB family chromosome partitioning protein
MTKSEKKLGMGLSGLVGNKNKLLSEEKVKNKSLGMVIKSDIHYLPLNMIIPNPNQPRKYFDSKAIDGLSKSIDDNGILQPILVKINKEKNKYEIISGERRYIASKKSETGTIPCIVKDTKELKSFELSIVENVQRENLSIIEEAKSYDKLNQKYNYSHEEIAKKVGFSRSRVSNSLRLLKLPKDIQEMISEKSISYGHARALINADNKYEVIESILQKSLSVREVEELVQKKGKNNKKQNSNNNSIKPEFIDFFESHNLSCTLKDKEGKGSLVIKYKEKQDIEDFISKIINITQVA